MKISTIETIIVLAGIFFIVVSLGIIIFGKKVGGRAGENQKIKYGNFEVNLNSVLMVLFLCILFAASPLILHYWRIDPSDFTSNKTIEESFMSKEIVKRDYMKIADLTLNINCFVLEKDSESTIKFADRVQVIAQRIDNGGPIQVFNGETDSMGNLTFCLSDIQINKNYKITWSKNNYQEVQQNLRFGNINYPITLTNRGNQ